LESCVYAVFHRLEVVLPTKQLFAGDRLATVGLRYCGEERGFGLGIECECLVLFRCQYGNRAAFFQRLTFDHNPAGNHFACDDFHASVLLRTGPTQSGIGKVPI
jgi:hypothetical protein